MEIGTLKELNVKPGDVFVSEYDDEGTEYNVKSVEGGVASISFDGITARSDDYPISVDLDNHIYRIVSRAEHQGPVRTVTRKEIVPGVYGALEVYTQGNRVGIKWHGFTDLDELTDAIETLIQIRDAM